MGESKSYENLVNYLSKTFDANDFRYYLSYKWALYKSIKNHDKFDSDSKQNIYGLINSIWRQQRNRDKPVEVWGE